MEKDEATPEVFDVPPLARPVIQPDANINGNITEQRKMNGMYKCMNKNSLTFANSLLCKRSEGTKKHVRCQFVSKER